MYMFVYMYNNKHCNSLTHFEDSDRQRHVAGARRQLRAISGNSADVLGGRKENEKRNVFAEFEHLQIEQTVSVEGVVVGETCNNITTYTSAPKSSGSCSYMKSYRAFGAGACRRRALLAGSVAVRWREAGVSWCWSWRVGESTPTQT